MMESSSRILIGLASDLALTTVRSGARYSNVGFGAISGGDSAVGYWP
jgi:hypothetical protein